MEIPVEYYGLIEGGITAFAVLAFAGWQLWTLREKPDGTFADESFAIGVVANPAAATITRPADTTAYASGDLVAQSVTAGSCSNRCVARNASSARASAARPLWSASTRASCSSARP